MNTDKYCFAWLAVKPHPGRTRGALLKAAKWSSGDIISVSFLDGSEELRDKVAKAARRWTAPGLANLQLVFREDTTSTLIRISFLEEGSWSTIGTTCQSITDRTQPTMNFGWLNDSSTNAEIREVVLHEFGHALGLVHEHQNPAGGIKWNKRQVYEDLSGPPNDWSKAEIDRNMFKPYSRRETNFTELDPDSIMMYPIPTRWTTDGFSADLNSNLSATDKAFIRAQYP